MPPRHNGRVLWGWWTIGSALGGFLGLALGPFGAVVVLATAFAVVDPWLGRDEAQQPLYLAVSWTIWLVALGLGGAIVGSILAAGQWLSVRGRLRLGGRWVGVTALGWAVGVPVGFAIELLTLPAAPPSLSLAIVGAVSGVLVGAGQWWFILRRHGMPPTWWIRGTIVAFIASHALGGLALAPSPASAGAGLLGGLVGGAPTGFILARHAAGARADNDR